MAKRRRTQTDFSSLVYTYIVNHVSETGEFPKTHEIARRCNLEYRTVYTCLKLLEKRGLVESRKGKRWAGFVKVERRLK